MGKRSKAENKEKKEKESAAKWVSLFTEDESKTDKSRSRGIKVREAGGFDPAVSPSLLGPARSMATKQNS